MPDTSTSTAPAAAVDLDDDATWVEALRTVRAQIADLEAKEAAIVEHLKQRLGAATEARINGTPVITWRWSKPSRRIDEKRLRAERPDIWKTYARTTAPSRRFVLDPKGGQ